MNAECAIWGTPAQKFPGSGDFEVYLSPRAGGSYRISRSALVDRYWKERSNAENVKLTTWLAEARKSGEASPLITSDIFDRVREKKRLSVATRRDQALLYLADNSPTINHAHTFSGAQDDEWRRKTAEICIVTESSDIYEATGFLSYLIDAGLLKNVAGNYVLTFEGWSAIENLNKNSDAGEQAFVAMWFDQSMADAYTYGIEPAVVERGYRSVRIDKKEHINKIDDEIIGEIRRSKFLISDFTSAPGCPRGGVYFEAGFAFGLNKPVIWTCRKDLIGEVHFDTRQYNHIVWSTPDELRTALSNRIGAVIGDGPLLISA